MTAAEMSAQTNSLEEKCLETKGVLTTDARMIGKMSGSWIDTSAWKVTSIVVALEKPIMSEMHMKKPLFKTVKVTIPVRLVSKVSDVVQLNTDLAGLVGVLAKMNP